MKDKFNEYIEGLETHRWVGVTDLSKQFDISERTVFQWLKDGKIEDDRSLYTFKIHHRKGFIRVGK